jgi:hypothetical protein
MQGILCCERKIGNREQGRLSWRPLSFCVRRRRAMYRVSALAVVLAMLAVPRSWKFSALTETLAR